MPIFTKGNKIEDKPHKRNISVFYKGNNEVLCELR